MGSGAISKLPEQLDRETVEKLVPTQFFDEQRFNECATTDGVVSRDVLAQRGAALEALNEAATLQKAGNDEGVLSCLQKAAEADPSFLLAVQSYAGALASADRTDEAIDMLLMYAARPGAGSEARVMAQQILLNDGIGKMNAGNSGGALDSFCRAEELGKVPPQIYEPIAAAKFMEARAVLQRDPQDTIALQRLTDLRSELEEILTSKFDSEGLVEMLKRVEALEALASGLGAIAKGDWAAAAPRLEAAADGGELGARSLAAQAYLKAAVSQFEAFTAARKLFSTKGVAEPASVGELAVPSPPALTRSLSDNGVSALAACQNAAESALGVSVVAKKEIEGSENVEQMVERLSQLDQVARELLKQVEAIHKMDESFRGIASDSDGTKGTAQSRLLLTPSSMSCGFEESVDMAKEEDEADESTVIAYKEDDHRELPAMEAVAEKEREAPKKHEVVIPTFETMAILKMFRKCDTDMDGAISREELTQIIGKLSPEPWDDNDLDLIFKALSTDGTEGISSGTFMGWMLGYERPKDKKTMCALNRCLQLFGSADWAAVEMPVAKPKEKVKTELDLKFEAAFESLKQTKATVQDMVERTDRAQKVMQEAKGNLESAGGALEQTLDKAKSMAQAATLQMAVQMGDKNARAELAKVMANMSNSTAIVPPPPKPKASWKRPDATARREAARANKEKEIPYWFRPCESFRPIDIPEVGEWLAEHKETGQTFRSWERLSMRVTPHAHVRVIELIVVGPWPVDAPSLDALVRYCEVFFLGCQVRISPSRLTIADFSARARVGQEGQLQICIGDIFDTLLKRRADRDVLCTVAITMADIYPIKDGVAWNFVFGQARMMDGVGVFSFSRFYPSGNFPLPWTGKDVSQGSYDADEASCENLDDAQRSGMLRSSCKVLGHEICHILGIKHCIYYHCLMCGSNNLEEARKKPMSLCPIDLRKLQHSCGFDVEARYRALAALYNDYGWTDDASWIGTRFSHTDLEELDALPALAEMSLERSRSANRTELSPEELEGLEKAELTPEELEGFEHAAVAGSDMPTVLNPNAASNAEERQLLCNRIREVPFLDFGHELFMHGRGYQGPKDAPKSTWVSQEKPRDDHFAPDWLTATEFSDVPQVMQAKVKELAQLLRASRKTVLYTGAGISASAVGQAARSGENTVGWKGSPLSAKPTPTHYALGFLGLQNLIHGWVQQNHDGLPQKAGFPQERINEIHGSWFDPSNPVVKYSGSLHSRAWPWMQEDAETADLVLVLGTSLGGLNADQVARNCADRSLLPGAGALGTVCINLQQTDQDGTMSLRIFGKSDIVLQALLREMGFGKLDARAPPWPKNSRVLVPYDSDGRRLPADERRWMWLDLNDRAKVRITTGHNIQGARQPKYMHIGAAAAVTFKGSKRRPAVGLGTVIRREDTHFQLIIEGEGMNLGLWWLVAAMNGSVPVLPIVNQKPAFEVAP